MALVTVASKLSHALRIRGDDPRVFFDIIGQRDPNSPELRGWGLTDAVDQTTFDQFLTANPHLAAFITIATQEQIDAATAQSNAFGYELGLAPVDPEVPPIETPPPVNRDVPYAQQEGGSLTCTMGNWDNYPTGYHYQWWQDGTMQIGADSNTLPLVPSDAGHTMTCVVQAYNSSGFTDAPPSNGVVVTMPTGPTPGLLISAEFSDEEMAGLVADLAANGSALLGFDILIDDINHTLRQQFGGVASPYDVCTLINAQLGPYAVTTVPGDAAPWQFHVTSNTTGAASSVGYAMPPSYLLGLYDSVATPRKKTTDIGATLRLKQITGAVMVPGSDVVSEAASRRSSARVPASVA